MTIGANDILNTTTEITQDKSSKKKDYTSEDFSTISNQFTNIFNTQFTNHFNNQFDYSANNKKTDFMASTVSSVTENKYYTPSNSVNSANNQKPEQQYSSAATNTNLNEEITNQTQQTQNNSETTQQQTTAETQQNTQQETTSANVENTTTTENTTEQAQAENKSQEPVQSSATNQAEAQNTSEKAAPTQAEKISPEALLAMQMAEATKEIKNTSIKNTDSTEQKTNNVKVAIKEDQLKTVNNLAQQTIVNQTPVSEVKEAKIEKLEIKTEKKALKEAAKEAKAEQHSEAKTELKDKTKEAETTKATEDIKNKVSLERLTANVIEEAPKETTPLDKLLNKEIKKVAPQAKDTTDAKAAIEFKNPTAFTQQNSEQNLGQNQNNQNQLKDNNLLKGLMPLDTSFVKNPINGNISFNNVMQNNPTNAALEKSIAEQVINQIKGNVSVGKSEVSMILNPEHLGKVTLNIMNEKGVLSAEIKTESKEAAEALNKNVNDLKETLKQQGIICTNLVVKIDDTQKSDNQMNFANQNNDHTSKNFEQGGSAQNSDKDSFQNRANNESAKAENQKNIQEEKDQPTAQTKTAEDNGLVDYRV